MLSREITVSSYGWNIIAAMCIRNWLLLFICSAAYAGTCQDLAKLPLPNVTITQADSVGAGPFTPPFGQPLGDLPAFCRIAATLKPSADSDIRIELWMPAAGWNGRLEGTGNGGFAGRISYGALAGGLRRGYAVVNTNMGTGTPQGQDATIFVGRPEVWADWGYRATHEMTVVSKQLVKAFYEKAPQRSYFAGCSTGGEQALMEAQRYPNDYDGIVAGAAANNRTGVHLSILWNYVVSKQAPLSKAKLAVVNQAAIQACAAPDGIIVNPEKCRFDPATLACKSTDADDCLTAPQVETVRQLYSGPVNPRTHEKEYPGLMPGSEFGWDQLAPKDNEPPYAPIFRWAFGRNWDWHSFDFDRSVKIYESALAKTVNAINPKLHEFQQAGHKLVVYHGWADWLVAPGESVRYYQQVKAANKDADSFYRLFMIPGMAHCSGGPGEDAIDPLTAVVDWVEHNKAPAQMVASKNKEQASSRLICPYPTTAKYNGTGDIHQANSYTCSVN